MYSVIRVYAHVRFTVDARYKTLFGLWFVRYIRSMYSVIRVYAHVRFTVDARYKTLY